MLFPGLLALIAFVVTDLVRAPVRLLWLAAVQLRGHGNYYLLGTFPLTTTDRYLSHSAGDDGRTSLSSCLGPFSVQSSSDLRTLWRIRRRTERSEPSNRPKQIQ